eukprot:1683998-Prymnesium_polylepis.2
MPPAGEGSARPPGEWGGCGGDAGGGAQWTHKRQSHSEQNSAGRRVHLAQRAEQCVNEESDFSASSVVVSGWCACMYPSL